MASIAKLVRSSTTGSRATIFGAYGFVGRYVTSLLAGSGTQCIIPYRGDDMEWRHLKPMGDLGVVVPVPFSPKDTDSVRRVIAGSDIVVNLIGKDYETKHYLPWLINSSYYETNVRIPELIAKIALEENVTCLLHMSALASDPDSESVWARTKAEGEDAVRAVAPGATLLRPADVFGPEDRLTNKFAAMHQLLPRLPLVDGGGARLQPIFVNDLAHAVFKIATSEDPEVMLGQTYDLAGPEEYTYRELVEYVFEQMRALQPEVANVSPGSADVLGRAIDCLPNPLVTRDFFRRMQADNVLDPLAPTKRLHDLGIEATSLEMPAHSWLHRHRTGSHFLDIAESRRGVFTG